jgi:hypothetical protein
MRSYRLLAAASALLAACSGISITGSDLPEGERVAVTALARPDHPGSGFSSRARRVIQSTAGWDSVATLLFHSSPPPASSFDFGSETVVVAAMGGRPTGGFSIAVDGAVVSGAELVVGVVERSPGRSCTLTQAPTAPVAVARVARAGLPVRFVERKEVYDC